MSEFRFRTKNGIHVYTYLEKPQISIFTLVDNKGNVISETHSHCEREEYHVRRVMNDFNVNNLLVADKSDNLFVQLWHQSKLKFAAVVGAIAMMPVSILIYAVVVLPFAVLSAMVEQNLADYE